MDKSTILKPGKFHAILLLCLILSGGAIFLQAQQGKKSDKLRQSRSKLEEEIRYTGEMLEKTKKEKQTSLNRVKILNRQIRTREKLINAINQELQDVEVQLTYESRQIDRMSSQLGELRREYARMVYQAWRTMNGHSKLMFIFSARDFNQAYQRLKYYQQFATYRRNQALKIESTKRNLHRHLQELEGTRVQKLELMGVQSEEKKKLDTERKEKDKAVQVYTSREKELMATLKQKQQAAQKLNSEIEKAINSEIRASNERSTKKPGSVKSGTKSAKTERPKDASSTTKLELTPGEVQLSSSFSANRGKLPWPCERGFISGNFGEHPHPVLRHVTVKNNGVDIMTEQGATIRSVFGGKVTKVMSFQFLNKVIIIRHGEYLTVYSNLGEVNIREGDEVKAKQVIGKVQTPPDDQRPELHFELWRGKTILNPELWLANR
jgi:septal ring factor EnvC (AmiA/AmiB activator)